jgi:glycosyltransferase involved in cell wall biosynthesis
MKLLYITFIDFEAGKSGSSVRPQKMYQAFLNNGVDIYLLSGSPKDKYKRKKAIKELKENFDTINPDFCYIEPPSGLLFLKEDRDLIRFLHKRNIPIGVFYRDMYWAYDAISSGNQIKDWIIGLLQKRDWKIYNNNADILYFPTLDMPRDFFVKSEIKALPPGTFEAVEINDSFFSKESEIPVGFYVGGLSKIYGVEKLLNAYEILNNTEIRSKLTLICREKEWEYFQKAHNFTSKKWLNVKHISGDELLKEEYQNADFAFCPQENNDYNNVTMSVKFMEAISYLKPVIATEVKPLKNIVDKYKIGLTCEDSEEALAGAINLMISDSSFYSSCLKNLPKARKDNSWEIRAKSVIDDLSKVKSKNESTIS